MESPLSTPQSVNFAPLAPLLQLGRGAPKLTNFLQDALKERFTHYLNLEKVIWNEMQSSGEQVSNFITGKHFLMPRPAEWGGGMMPYTPPSGVKKRAMNIFQFYVSNCLFKWLLSNPDIEVNPAIDTDEAEEAAVAASVIVDHYEREFYTVPLVIEEALQGICWGSYIWRLFPDPGKTITHAIREVMENRSIALGDGYGQCANCGYAGTAKDFNQVTAGEGAKPFDACPECDSEAYVEPPAQANVPVVTERQQVPIFDLSAKIIPFPTVRWNLAFRFEDSPWAIVRNRTNLGVIKSVFGNVTIPDSASGSGGDLGLDIADRMAYAGQPQAGYGNRGDRPKLYDHPVTIEEHFMHPEDYCDIELKGDTETVSGQSIPAGRLVDHFPNGLLVQGLNEMAVVVGLYGERHKPYTVQGTWYSRPMSGAGRGLQDLVEVNKRLNADDSQIHEYLRQVSTPAMLVLNGALGEEARGMYANTPGENIPIDMVNLPEGMKPSDAITPAFTPVSVPAQMFDYTYNRLNNMAQIVSHITDFSAGLPGVNNKTATGARITQANSNALFTAPLQVKTQTRVDIMKKTVPLYKTHIPIERYFPLKGKYGRAQGMYLSGANLCTDLMFDAVPDSEIPKNSEIKRDDYTAFFMAFGGYQIYAMAKQEDADLVADMEHAFGIKVRAKSYSVVASLCLKRVKQMAQFAQMVQDPQALLMAIQPPVSQKEDQVDKKIQWLRDYLDSDNGLESPLHLRAGIELLIDLHYQMLTQTESAKALLMGTAQAAGAAPGMIAQTMQEQATQQPDQQEPPPQATPDNEAKMKDNKEQRTHESKESSLDREHELRIAKIKAQEAKARQAVKKTVKKAA